MDGRWSAYKELGIRLDAQGPRIDKLLRCEMDGLFARGNVNFLALTGFERSTANRRCGTPTHMVRNTVVPRVC